MKFRLSSEFGELSEVRDYKPHTGIDISMPTGTELRSFTDGIVTEVFNGADNIGKGVKIQLENGKEIIYGHMSKVNVKVNEIVTENEVLGFSGSTGHSTAPHLHFGLKENGQFIDPTYLYDSIVSHSGSGFNWNVLFQNRFQYNPNHESFMDKFFTSLGENLSDFIIKSAHDFATWLTSVMPDIGAYMTIITGVLIMVTAKTGKWIAWYSAGMFGVCAWLMNAE